LSIYEQISLQVCPKCGGTGTLEDEHGLSWYITCVDCGAHTADVEFHNEAESLDAAQRVAYLWNIGKVVSHDPGE